MSQSNITIVDTSNGGDNHSGPVSPVIRRRKVMFADEVHEGQNGDQEPQDRSDSMKYEEKQSVFGLRPWSAKMRSNSSIREKSPEKDTSEHSYFTFWNILWTILFGWWMAFFYVLCAGLLTITVIGLPYARLCWSLASYFFWPFGKFIIREFDSNDEERRPLNSTEPKRKLKGNPVGYAVWLIFAVFILSPIHLVILFITWMVVIFIPMAKVNLNVLYLLFNSPMSLKIAASYPGPGADVVLCTHQAVNVHYYKYSVGGMNIILVNILPFVVFSLVEGWIVPHEYQLEPMVMFIIDLLCIIPISFYIGMAVSSIAAQTNYIIGAFLNAGFGTIVEVLLYVMALKKGKLDTLVQYGVTGALLSNMLLLPGLSMIAGGFKYKEQRFNPSAAGVSSVMLLVSVLGAFTPTIFYTIYGNHSLNCSLCTTASHNSTMDLSCKVCVYEQLALDEDPMYTAGARPLMYFCAAILPICYIVGLIFTLKTHSHIFQATEEEEEEMKHHAPEWSILVSIIVLLIASAVFGLIAENLVEEIQPVLNTLNISQSFLGLTLIAVVPAIAEFVNAILFAINDNIALSMEIATSGSVQCALIQMPVLVAASAIFNSGSSVGSFTLIFPLLNLGAVVFAVLVLNYVSIRGKSNYFEGASLVFIYALLVAAFYYVPSGEGSSESITNSTNLVNNTVSF
jgi:Ca2+:H+ antiporter